MIRIGAHHMSPFAIASNLGYDKCAGGNINLRPKSGVRPGLDSFCQELDLFPRLL